MRVGIEHFKSFFSGVFGLQTFPECSFYSRKQI